MTIVSQMKCISCGGKTFTVFKDFNRGLKQTSNIAKCISCEGEQDIADFNINYQ